MSARRSLSCLAVAALVVGCSGAGVRSETEPSLESMAKLATEDLIERMLDPRATDRVMVPALSVLQKAEQLPKSALPKLRAALRVELAANQLSEPEECHYDPCRPRLAYLVELAGLWKREASALRPELLDAWRWKDARIAQEARSALAAMGAPEALPDILRALQESRLSDAQRAAWDLSRFASIAPLGDGARSAVSAIERRLSREPEPDLRSPFLLALGAIADERAISVLQAELLRGVADASTAAEELAKLGPAAASALPDLHTLAETH